MVRRHGGVCPCCREKFLAPVTKGLGPGSRFGSSVVVLAVDFHHNQAVSFERLVALFREVFGLKISEGAIGNMYKRSMPAFANQTDGIKARLLRTTIMGSDETTVRVNKINWWLSVVKRERRCLTAFELSDPYSASQYDPIIQPSRAAAISSRAANTCCEAASILPAAVIAEWKSPLL